VTTNDVQHLEAGHVLQTYRRAPVVFTRGQGIFIYDEDGQQYTDLISGIGAASLGHSHPGLVSAIADQARTLLHTSNLFFHPLQGQLARQLADMSGLSRTFFCNSGAEAVEACLKFAKRHWHTRGDAKRTEIIALEHSFHGRTFGALSTTSSEAYRVPFQPLLPGVQFIPVTVDALKTAVSSSTQAIIVEPIQGEGGIRPLPQAFAEALNEVCARFDVPLIADEVQCGLGRTGKPFYYQKLGLQPDLVAIGKALGGGVPVAAALVNERIASTVSYGDHGSTYGGNLLSCRAALVFLDELINKGLLDHVATIGPQVEKRLRALAERRTEIVEVRGQGLMWGLEVNTDVDAIVDAARNHRLLINRTSGSVVRLLPPLIITLEEIDQALETLEAAFTDVANKKS
jgi:predicted acetylornithine/succinylornithine family transaminase